MSEKTIYVRRASNPTRLSDEHYADASTRIGPAFDGKKPLSAFTSFEDEKKYLAMVGIDPADPKFAEKAREFWNEINIRVLPDEGTPLQIGTDKDGNPVDAMDFIHYKYLLRRPREVAKSKNGLLENSSALYYLYNAEEQVNEDYKAMEEENEAYLQFMTLTKDKKNSSKLDQVLSVLNISIFEKDFKEKVLLAKEASRENRKRFIAVATDPLLETKALIVSLSNIGSVQKVNNLYLYGEKELGDSLEQAARFISTPSESQTLLSMKSALKEALK